MDKRSDQGLEQQVRDADDIFVDAAMNQMFRELRPGIERDRAFRTLGHQIMKLADQAIGENPSEHVKDIFQRIKGNVRFIFKALDEDLAGPNDF